MNKLPAIVPFILLFALISSRVHAQHYPFILEVRPAACTQCKNSDIAHYHSLVQALLNSGIFIGDSSSYSVPAGAYNPPSASGLTRTLSVEITRKHAVYYKEHTQYLKEKIETDKYSLHITISSDDTPREFTVQYQNLSPLQLGQTFEIIAQNIIAYYSSKRIPVIFQSPMTFSLTAIALSPVYIAPITKLNDYAQSGTGFQISSYVGNNQIPALIVIPSLSWFMLNDPIISIRSWHSVSLMIHAGCRINLPLSFSLIPFIGAGYIVHSINGDTQHTYPPFSYSRSFHYNPQMATGMTLGLSLDPQLSLSAGAVYTTFFESSSRCAYIQYTAGFTFHFEHLLYQTTVYH